MGPNQSVRKGEEKHGVIIYPAKCSQGDENTRNGNALRKERARQRSQTPLVAVETMSTVLDSHAYLISLRT